MKTLTFYAQCLSNPLAQRPRYALYRLIKGKLEILWSASANGNEPTERKLFPHQVYYRSKSSRDKLPAFHFRPCAGGTDPLYVLAADLAEYFLCDVQIFRLTGWGVENERVRACNECRVCLKSCTGKTHHAKCRPAAKRLGIKV